MHRILMEEYLERPLRKGEVVHHIDYDRTNNVTDNLMLCIDQEAHMLQHAKQKVEDLGGIYCVDKYCSYHQCLHTVEDFSTNPSMYDGLNNNCRKATNEYRAKHGLNKNKFDWRARLNQQYRRLFRKDLAQEKINNVE